jgi:hypothetical protein
MITLQPMKFIMYPDRSGYTGFSIGIWDIIGCDLSETLLERDYGAAKAYNATGTGDYILEARFFVFGSLPKLIFRKYNKQEAERMASEIFSSWKPIMDNIIEKRNTLYGEPDRNSIHVDEVMTPDIRKALSEAA